MREQMKDVGCEFAADIIAYMYREMAVKEQLVFEKHLAVCQVCIDEFAAVSEARYSVYEWQRAEFAPLETPVIQIPVSLSAGVEKVSFFSKIRAAFAFYPAVAAASIIAVIGIGLLANQLLNDRNEVAELANVETRANSVQAPSPVPAASAHNAAVPEKPANFGPDREKSDRVSQDRKVIQLSDKNTRARTSMLVEQHRTETVKAIQPIRSSTPPQNVQARTAPRLNGSAEDEDESLRLADIFDDIDTFE
jgi:hypothetical protein